MDVGLDVEGAEETEDEALALLLPAALLGGLDVAVEAIGGVFV